MSTEPAAAATQQVTVEEAVRMAADIHKQGRLADAETLYRRILGAAPEHPDALHLYGLLHHQRGDDEAAAALIRRAIAQVPDFPDYHLNLGNVLVELGRIEEAEGPYRRALELKPDFADAWNNLGSIERHLDRLDDAEAAYRRCLELVPEHPCALDNMGTLCGQRGDAVAATEYYCRSIVANPDRPDGHKLLGVAWTMLGERGKAAEAFREWLQRDPDNPEAQHLYAACSDEPPPERASDEYVEYAFDHFATSFEHKLAERLHYRAPALLAEALRRHAPPPAGALKVLDAGCGTGLCGPLLKPWSARLVGVDLSAGMLGQATRKQCYDALEKAELTAWLEACQADFDLIVSADTLCYFGPLDRIVGAAAAALRPGGMLAFTVERIVAPATGDTHRIESNGRYRHASPYVETCLAGAGLIVAALDEAVLRVEAGRDVPGLVVVARR